MYQSSKTNRNAADYISAMEQKPLQKRGESENPIVKSRNKFMYLSGLFLLVLTLGLFSSCGDKAHPSALVGSWQSVGDEITSFDNGRPNMTARITTPKRLILRKDGTGVYEDMTITWRVDSKSLALSSVFQSDIFNYQISGKVLSLTKDESYCNCHITTTYNKQ